MKSHIAYRISYFFLEDDRKFAELVAALEENRKGFDSLALFTSWTHGVVSLDVMRPRVAVMKKRIAELKRHGWEVGVNLLCASGFFREFDDAIPEGFVHHTDLSGNTCFGAFCVNQEKYRQEYLIPLFRMLAEADPDYLWLDDDNSKFACCCDHCLELFNRRQHRSYTREQLNAALNAGTPEEKLQLREAHLQFAADTYRDLYSLAEKTVHKVNPKIGLGAMTCNDHIASAGLPEALAGGTDCTVLWRPGGGAWHEQVMDEFLFRKGGDLANECAWLPERVDRIQAEIESFNYQRLQKSVHSTVLETCIYVAAGCTGAAYNIFDGLEPLDVYKPIMTGLTNVRGFLDRLVEAHARRRPQGIYTGWTPRRNAARALEKGEWFGANAWTESNPNDLWAGESTASRSSQLFCTGLPPTYRLEDARATMLIGEVAWSLSDDELRRILSGGLYCDVNALEILHRRGFGKLTGFRAGAVFDHDASERLLPHPLNGDGVGCIRNGRQAFSRAYSGRQLESLDGKGEALAELIDYHNRILAPCSLGYYENELGGRVAVSGYFADRNLLFYSKVRQLKNLFRRLSHDTLPAYVDTYHRIGLWVRENEGRSVITLVNASMDPAQGAELLVKTSELRAELTGMYDDCCEVSGLALGDGYVKFTLPDLPPWQLYLFLTGDKP